MLSFLNNEIHVVISFFCVLGIFLRIFGIIVSSRRSRAKQVVSEHFLGQSGEYFLFLQEFFGAASLQIKSVRFGEKSAKSNCRSGLFVKKYPSSKKNHQGTLGSRRHSS